MDKLEKLSEYNKVLVYGYKGSLTDLGKEHGIDAVVNAANNALCLGWSTKRFSEFALGWSVGGVANAIRIKAGEKVMDECREIIKKKNSWLNPGKAAYTSGGNLNVDYIIHAASTTFFGSSEDIIRDCIRNSILLSYELEVKGITFPLLGGGAGMLSAENIATYMREEFQRNLKPEKRLNKIVIAINSDKKYNDFCKIFARSG